MTGIPSKAHLYRTLSGIYTVQTFRNLHIIEKQHSEGVNCNTEFYTEVLLKVADEYQNLNDAFNGKNDEYFEMLEESLKFCLSYFRKWQNPIKIRERMNCSIPEYVLHGRFKEICINGEKLTEDNMMQCNIDIRNRYYTLINRSIIENTKLKVN